MEAHIARWDDSLALRIPRPVAERLGLGEGAAVDLSVEQDRLVVRPRARQPSLEDLLDAITPENLPESGLDDVAVGREAL